MHYICIGHPSPSCFGVGGITITLREPQEMNIGWHSFCPNGRFRIALLGLAHGSTPTNLPPESHGANAAFSNVTGTLGTSLDDGYGDLVMKVSCLACALNHNVDLCSWKQVFT